MDSLKLHPSSFPDMFNLKVLDESVKLESVWRYLDESTEGPKSYEGVFVVDKKNSYTAFCNILQYGCEIDYSCVIQREGSLNFSKVPSVHEVDDHISCLA